MYVCTYCIRIPNPSVPHAHTYAGDVPVYLVSNQLVGNANNAVDRLVDRIHGASTKGRFRHLLAVQVLQGDCGSGRDEVATSDMDGLEVPGFDGLIDFIVHNGFDVRISDHLINIHSNK
jgi:hypothetical protein